MPNKLSPVSRPIQQLADDQTDTKPAKGFQRVAARIAKPLKGLGVWGGGRPTLETSVNHVARAFNLRGGPVAERPVSAECLASMDKSFARRAASSKVDNIFDSKLSELENCKLKLLEVRDIMLNAGVVLQKCEKKLSALPAFDEKNKSQLQAKILKLGRILTEADEKKTLFASGLKRAFDDEIETIKKQVNDYESQLPGSSMLGQERLHTKIAAAQFAILDLEVGRENWLDKTEQLR